MSAMKRQAKYNHESRTGSEVLESVPQEAKEESSQSAVAGIIGRFV
jgi:hypothetical protein